MFHLAVFVQVVMGVVKAFHGRDVCKRIDVGHDFRDVCVARRDNLGAPSVCVVLSAAMRLGAFVTARELRLVGLL